jgi:hypothetical protein
LQGCRRPGMLLRRYAVRPALSGSG